MVQLGTKERHVHDRRLEKKGIRPAMRPERFQKKRKEKENYQFVGGRQPENGTRTNVPKPGQPGRKKIHKKKTKKNKRKKEKENPPVEADGWWRRWFLKRKRKKKKKKIPSRRTHCHKTRSVARFTEFLPGFCRLELPSFFIFFSLVVVWRSSSFERLGLREFFSQEFRYFLSFFLFF